MDKITGKIKQSVKKRNKKPYDRTPNSPKPCTASSAGQGTHTPAIASTSSRPAFEQIVPPLPLATVPALHPEPNNVTQPPAAPITPEPRPGQVAAQAGWSGLEAFLKVTSRLSQPFSPLKQAVGGMLEAVEAVELAARNREDF
ncbi:hypothetical protein FRC12_019171 [Ceratobasidium sp. 428]|nr:hypothetical protein FRC12_019171 [Ceratobasidium sp. 428]